MEYGYKFLGNGWQPQLIGVRKYGGYENANANNKLSFEHIVKIVNDAFVR
jgi:hypothetical protein